MNLRDSCWTVIGKGPRGTKLLICTAHGLLDSYLNFEDAVEDARDHLSEYATKDTK